LVEENKKLKTRLTEGEKSLIMTATREAELDTQMAERAYKEAYDSGDSDQILEAQKKLNTTSNRLERLKGYTDPLYRLLKIVYKINQHRQQPLALTKKRIAGANRIRGSVKTRK
jgi:hypothetical protein